jgi:hypothetical protein
LLLGARHSDRSAAAPFDFHLNPAIRSGENHLFPEQFLVGLPASKSARLADFSPTIQSIVIFAFMLRV